MSTPSVPGKPNRSTDREDVVSGEIAQSPSFPFESAHFVAIVESSDDAIISKTLEGIVTSWNAGAERLFGYSREEMVGRPISTLFPADRAEDLPTLLDAIQRGERVEHFETERVRKDGRRIHVSLTLSPIKDASGRIVGASKIARDVTARKAAETERERLLAVAEQARAEAEALNRAKDEFLASLGHELRNPLAAIRSAVAAALLDENRRGSALEIVGRQSDRLARLVDDLLEVSRITQGRIRLRKERVLLADVVARALETSRVPLEERGHAPTVVLGPQDAWLEGDPVRLEQIVDNLLTNAAKYTAPGASIEIVARREGDDAVLRVRDEGIGIDAELLPHVFDLFFQAESRRLPPDAGLGLGLTLVRRLVGLHGGRVEAHSGGPGRGAEFVVKFPAAPALPGRAGAAEAAKPASRGEPRHILVVEDNRDVAESFAALLEIEGHRVGIARDGATALAAAEAEVPDLMLIDIGLPDFDGYELARRARRLSSLRSTWLVALTGYGREEDRRRARDAGFDRHLTKPVEVDDVRALLASLGSRGGDRGSTSSG